MENPGKWWGGVLSEIPSVVGYGYFLEPHNKEVKKLTVTSVMHLASNRSLIVTNRNAHRIRLLYNIILAILVLLLVKLKF